MMKIVLVLALTFILAPLRANAQAVTPGTYHVWLCATACRVADSSEALASAVLVLLEDSTAATDAARAALSALRATYRPPATGLPDNACFRVLSRMPRVGNEELFFGIQRIDATRWQHDATRGFSLRVYFSPDAGYTLRWWTDGPLLAGEGWSYGWQAQAREHQNAFFAARRIGPADIAQCTQN